MPSLCVAPIRGTVMRLVKEDVCGVPVTGAASAVVVSNGFVQVVVAPNYETQGAIRQRTASGALCINEPDQTELLEVGVTVDFCLVDPDAIVIATGDTLITGGPPVTGTGMWFGGGIITARFSLEVWQPVAGAGACTPGGLQQYTYWAFPNLGSTAVGSFNIENSRLAFTIAAVSKAAAVLWGDGPGTGTSWLPGPVPVGKHFGFNVTTTAPPTPPVVCGAFALT